MGERRFEIIHKRPSDAEIKFRELCGFEAVRLWDGRMAWVHENDREEPTQEQLQQMYRDWGWPIDRNPA